jgi:Na+-driven multidrug efflux pump
MTLLGFFVGSLVPNAEKYLHLIIIGIIALSFVPVILEWLKARKGSGPSEL